MKKVKQTGLVSKVISLLQSMQHDPFVNPPRYEALVGNLNGYYSRRINIKHRLVYSVDMDQHTIHVLRCWTHYE